MKKIVIFLMLGLMFATIIVHATITDTIGNESSVTRDVTVVKSTGTLTLTSLSLESNATTLNKGERAQLSVVATYSDHSSKVVDANITYIITPAQNAKVNGTVLTALKDGSVTVQAKVGTILSNTIDLNITWVVNGHTLPPEPDKVLNDATLLGIDINDNGVRDDVERWIYEEYKDKHPIHIDIAMQAGKAYKQVLETPERAKEIHDTVVNAPLYCASYYEFEAQFFNDPILVDERIDAPVKSRYFNTKTRSDVYWEYDKLLSGDSYPLPKDNEMKSFCDFDTSKYKK